MFERWIMQYIIVFNRFVITCMNVQMNYLDYFSNLYGFLLCISHIFCGGLIRSLLPIWLLSWVNSDFLTNPKPYQKLIPEKISEYHTLEFMLSSWIYTFFQNSRIFSKIFFAIKWKMRLPVTFRLSPKVESQNCR